MRTARTERTARRGACVLATVLLWMGMAQAGAQNSSPIPADEAWDAERAAVEMERLRTEIRILGGLAGAQAALEAWNRERAESGAGPEVLPARLCAERALAPWCRALPATFGADAAGAAANGRAGDGEP